MSLGLSEILKKFGDLARVKTLTKFMSASNKKSHLETFKTPAQMVWGKLFLTFRGLKHLALSDKTCAQGGSLCKMHCVQMYQSYVQAQGMSETLTGTLALHLLH